jgi:hypothetical protein
MAGRQRTTFAKLQKERARQEKQAAKRARRQGLVDPTAPADIEGEPMFTDEFGVQHFANGTPTGELTSDPADDPDAAATAPAESVPESPANP